MVFRLFKVFANIMYSLPSSSFWERTPGPSNCLSRAIDGGHSRGPFHCHTLMSQGLGLRRGILQGLPADSPTSHMGAVLFGYRVYTHP